MNSSFRSFAFGVVTVFVPSLVSASASEEIGTRLPDVTREMCERYLLTQDLPVAAFPIQAWKVNYRTSNPHAKRVEVSGIIARPANLTASAPWTVYQHGTKLDRSEAPSRGHYEAIWSLCNYGTAGTNYIAADYVGLGDSQETHPYLHAATEAGAARDLITVVREYESLPKIRVFVTGYSQGGHAAMALHRDLETRPDEHIEVIASAPMAGPYDVSGASLRATLEDPEPFASTVYTSYVLTAFQDIYGDVFKNPGEVFASAFAELPELIRKQVGRPVTEALPALPTELLNPSFLSSLRSDPTHPFHKRLAQNDVYNWAPQAPTLLVFSKMDKVVSPENARVAFARMKELGGNVEILNVGDDLKHDTGSAPSFAAGRRFLKTILMSLPFNYNGL